MDIFKTLLIQNPPNLALEGQVSYQGTWDASANSPALTSSVGTKGYYYVVSTSGSTNLNGVTTWTVGDWAIFNGAVWQKVDNTDAITSINGTTNQIVASSSTGDVTLSLPTTIANVNSITAQSATNLTLSSGSSGASLVLGQGANGLATITPTGTGAFAVNSTGLFSEIDLNASGVANGYFFYDTSTTTVGIGSVLNRAVKFMVNASEKARFTATNGNLLLGTTTDSSNGRIQLATHTTSAGGIGFGTDVSLYRNFTSQLSTNAGALTGGVGIGYFSIIASGTSPLIFNNGDGEAFRVTSGRGVNIGGTGAVSAGSLAVSGTTASSSTTTGALVVSGGMGVAGAGYFGGVLSAQAGKVLLTSANSATAGTVNLARSTSSAMTQYLDGSGKVDANAITLWTSGGAHPTGYEANNGRWSWYMDYTTTPLKVAEIYGASLSDAALTVFGTTASSSTTTGALVVSGGVGVAGALYTGGNLFVGGSSLDLNNSNNGQTAITVTNSNAGTGAYTKIGTWNGTVGANLVTWGSSYTGRTNETWLYTNGAYPLKLGTDSTIWLTIAPTTGLATFGGNVNATSATLTNSSTGTTAQAALNFSNGTYSGRLAINGTAYTNDGVAGSNRTELQAPFSLNVISGQFKFFSNNAGSGEGTSGASNIYNILGPSLGGRMEHLPQNYSAGPYLVGSTVGAFTSWNAATLTDNSTAASGTVASQVFHNFRQPVLAATNAGVTTTDATTIYIAGGPAQSTNQTITNSYGLWNAGKTRLDNTVLVGTGTNSSNGIIQLATHTTSAGGIGFGTDFSLFRYDTSDIILSPSSGGRTVGFRLSNGSGNSFRMLYGYPYAPELYADDALSIRSNTGSITLKSNNATALTLDSSQNATFAGSITSSVGTGGVGTQLVLNNSATNSTIGRGSALLFTGTGAGNLASVESQTATASNNAGLLLIKTSNAGTLNIAARYDNNGNLIQTVTGTAPTLATNSTMTFELTSNTELKIKVRGTDGTTRSVSLTLA